MVVPLIVHTVFVHCVSESTDHFYFGFLGPMTDEQVKEKVAVDTAGWDDVLDDTFFIQNILRSQFEIGRW